MFPDLIIFCLILFAVLGPWEVSKKLPGGRAIHFHPSGACGEPWRPISDTGTLPKLPLCKVQTVEKPDTGLLLTQQRPLLLTQQRPLLFTQQRPLVFTQQRPLLLTEQGPLLVTEQRPLLLAKQRPLLFTQQSPLLLTKQRPLLLTKGRLCFWGRYPGSSIQDLGARIPDTTKLFYFDQMRKSREFLI